MDTVTLEGLARHLDDLHRKNKRLRWAGCVILAGLAGLLLTAQALPGRRILEADRLILQDASGRRWAVIGTLPDGTEGLALYDRHGTVRAALTVGPDGDPSPRLIDRRARPRAEVTVEADRVPAVQLHGERGQVRADLKVVAGSSPALGLYDEATIPRAMFAVAGDGRPMLALYDGQAAGIVRLGQGTDGSADLDLNPTDRNSRAAPIMPRIVPGAAQERSVTPTGSPPAGRRPY